MASRTKRRRKANSNGEIVLEDGDDIVDDSNNEMAAGEKDVVATLYASSLDKFTIRRPFLQTDLLGAAPWRSLISKIASLTFNL